MKKQGEIEGEPRGGGGGVMHRDQKPSANKVFHNMSEIIEISSADKSHIDKWKILLCVQRVNVKPVSQGNQVYYYPPPPAQPSELYQIQSAVTQQGRVQKFPRGRGKMFEPQK